MKLQSGLSITVLKLDPSVAAWQRTVPERTNRLRVLSSREARRKTARRFGIELPAVVVAAPGTKRDGGAT